MNNQKTLFNRFTLALVALSATTALLAHAPVARAQQAPATGQVVGYYEAYAGRKAIAQVPWQALTRLNVAFIGVDKSQLAVWLVADGKDMPDLSGDQIKTVRALVAARDQNNPNVKLMLSVGGATMSNNFSKAVSTDEGIRRLSLSSVNVAQSLGLDGVDYDWEYPGRLVHKNCHAGPGQCESPNDFANLTKLLRATREKLAPGKLLTVAVYFDPSAKGVPYDVAGMDPYLDAWNVMAYDIAAPSWVTATAFSAGVQASTASLDAFVHRGAKPEKMILGVPLYSYIWKSVPWAGVGAVPTAAQGDKAGRQYSIQTLFDRYSGQEGCKLYETNDGDFYYCSLGTLAGEWCPIDSVRVLQQKGAFVRDGGYGGLMSWSVSMDTPTQLMANTMQQALR